MNPDNTSMLAAGLLLGRLVIGSLLAAHGAQKLLGWFGGYGLRTTGEFFVQLGFRHGPLFAAAASISEIAGGILIASGFLGPVGPALLLAVMIVAAGSVHWKHGLFAQTNGIELPLLYASAAVALALIGPGSYSLDALLGLSTFWTPALTGTILGLGALGGVANLLTRRAPKQPSVVS